MKNQYYLVIFCIFIFGTTVFSQENKVIGVKKNMYGIQTGLLGVWVYNETKLNNNFTLRTEIGLDGGYSYSDFNEPKSQYSLLPSISVEPRWYYNFEKRTKMGKSIANNAVNFWSLRTTYNPNWFEITNSNSNLNASLLRIMPSWGFRRDLGANIDFELRLGFGFASAKSNSDLASCFIPDFSVRFGYSF